MLFHRSCYRAAGGRSVFFHRSCHRAAGDLQYRRFPTLTLHFLKLNIRCYTKLIVINILSVDNIFSWQLGSSDSNGTLYIYISLRRQLLSYLRLWFPWQISAPADVEQHLFFVLAGDRQRWSFWELSCCQCVTAVCPAVWQLFALPTAVVLLPAVWQLYAHLTALISFIQVDDSQQHEPEDVKNAISPSKARLAETLDK